MKLRFHCRTWHIKISIFLALPILTVALTTLLMAHKKTLGTEDVTVAAGWLPGYQVPVGKAARTEVRASLTMADGETYIGTLGGLYRLERERLVAVAELAGVPVRALAEAPWGRIAAAKGGIWLEQGGHWQRVLKGDAWLAAARPDGSLAVSLKDKGVLVSNDGRRWLPDDRIAAALAALPGDAGSEPITLARLVMDVHSGRALFGKDGEWIWIDLVGLALCLLGLTGVYMWASARRRKSPVPRASN